MQVRVFLPKSRRDRAHAKADQKRLNKMLSQGHLILTPSRKSDGALWSSFDCNEEDYIVRYAAQREAVIVSTRRFEDFEEPRLQEQVGQSLSGLFPPIVTSRQVERRVLVFTFSSEKEFDPPMDPHGRGGPSLETFLHFPSQNHCPVPEPEIVSQPEQNLFKRQIIVDGSNVGHAYTGNARFNAIGI